MQDKKKKRKGYERVGERGNEDEKNGGKSVRVNESGG